MKQFKLFIIAMTLAVIVGCAGRMPNRTGYFQPDSSGQMRSNGEVRSSGDPETIRAAREYMDTAEAWSIIKDPRFNTTEKMVLRAIEKGSAVLRELRRLLKEQGISVSEPDPSPTATHPVETAVAQTLKAAGFTHKCIRGEWAWFYPPYDPAYLSPLTQEGAMIVYEKKGRPDEGSLIASIKAKYH